MIWAIGAVDQVCRLIIETTDEDAAERQCLTGEVAVLLDTPQRGVIRAVDGVHSVEPLDLEPPWRAERNRMLAATDWTQLPDAPLDDAQRAAWSAYRQSLRDHDGTGPLPVAPDQ